MSEDVSVVEPSREGDEAREGGGAQEFHLFKKKLLDEVLAMAEFAHEQRRPISEQSEWMLLDLEKSFDDNGPGANVQLLTELHRDLSEAIAPAMPKSVLYLKVQKEKAWSLFKWISPIGNIRYMIMASFVSLAAFVGLSLTDWINEANLKASFLLLEGWNQAVVALFLLSASGIGATFANLYKAYSHVPNGTYDPDYNATYWVRFALGLTSGYVLAELITLDVEATLSKPLLALLGGFSASAVFRVLTRMVEAVETIVQGDAKTRIEMKQLENMAKLQIIESQRKAEHIAQVVELKARLQESGASGEQIKMIDDLINKATRRAHAAAQA